MDPRAILHEYRRTMIRMNAGILTDLVTDKMDREEALRQLC